AISAVALALLGGIGVSSWQAMRATRAERVALDQATKASQAESDAKAQAETARRESEKAKAIQDFLTENLLVLNPLGGTTPDPAAISAEATRDLVEKVARKVEGRFTNQPLTEAAIRMTLVFAFGESADAANMASQAEKALQIRQRLLLDPAHSD